MSAHYYPRYRKDFAHFGRKANLDGESQPLFPERFPAFNGLIVAALIATPFWVPLVFFILKLK